MIENLNLDNPFDEDWFTWNADDTWYDDPDIAVTVEGGFYNYFIVEVWLEEWDASHPLASKEGWESITITEDDFPFDDGWFWDSSWDNWYVTVRTDPDAWSFLTCEEDFYTLTIES